MDVDYDDENYEAEHDYDAPAESDLQYSDEMSRQAVGKLFAGGGKNDNAGGPLVRGYREGAGEKPARPQARPVRQAPAPPSDSGNGQVDRAREIRVVERGRPRRESATTRITQPEGQNDAFKSGVREAARATTSNMRTRPVEGQAKQNAREGPEAQEVGGGLNIQDPPRARQPRAAAAEGQQARPRQQAAQQGEDSLDLDGFRQRYNPGEMISPPRAKSRPVRAGQTPQREVKKDRVRISDKDLETINSFRLVIVGSCVLVVALIGFLAFRWAVVAGQRNDAEETILALQNQLTGYSELQARVEELEGELSYAQGEQGRLRSWLTMYGIDPDGTPDDEYSEGGPGPPGPGGTQPPRREEAVFRPVIPEGGRLEHFIEPSQSLASIAQIYWPHNPETPSGRQVRDQLISHLVATNDIANPETIFAGQWLLIYAHPQIDQVFD